MKTFTGFLFAAAILFLLSLTATASLISASSTPTKLKSKNELNKDLLHQLQINRKNRETNNFKNKKSPHLLSVSGASQQPHHMYQSWGFEINEQPYVAQACKADKGDSFFVLDKSFYLARVATADGWVSFNISVPAPGDVTPEAARNVFVQEHTSKASGTNYVAVQYDSSLYVYSFNTNAMRYETPTLVYKNDWPQVYAQVPQNILTDYDTVIVPYADSVYKEFSIRAYDINPKTASTNPAAKPIYNTPLFKFYSYDTIHVHLIGDIVVICNTTEVAGTFYGVHAKTGVAVYKDVWFYPVLDLFKQRAPHYFFPSPKFGVMHYIVNDYEKGMCLATMNASTGQPLSKSQWPLVTLPNTGEFITGVVENAEAGLSYVFLQNTVVMFDSNFHGLIYLSACLNVTVAPVSLFDGTETFVSCNEPSNQLLNTSSADFDELVFAEIPWGCDFLSGDCHRATFGLAAAGMITYTNPMKLIWTGTHLTPASFQASIVDGATGKVIASAEQNPSRNPVSTIAWSAAPSVVATSANTQSGVFMGNNSLFPGKFTFMGYQFIF